MLIQNRRLARLNHIPPYIQGWTAWVSTVVRVILAAVLAWAGVAKIGDPDVAVRAVRAYQIAPEVFVRPIAWSVPFLEIGIALLLVVGIGRRAAPGLAAILFALFALGIAQAWARNLQINCGCFGGGGPAHADAARYLAELGRDLVLLGMTVWLTWHPANRLALHSHSEGC